MVVTNYEPQYGESDPVPVSFRQGYDTVEQLIDHNEDGICYPVDGDMLHRAVCQGRYRQAKNAGMTELASVPYAQEQLSIERMGITGQWVHDYEHYWVYGLLPVSRRHAEHRQVHSYVRWADL